jgi:hypothetical protein
MLKRHPELIKITGQLEIHPSGAGRDPVPELLISIIAVDSDIIWRHFCRIVISISDMFFGCIAIDYWRYLKRSLTKITLQQVTDGN